MAKVSIIVPVYNVERYLAECLDSLLRQTLSDIEIICVDDGSTDSSPEILAAYAARDARVRVIKKENRGYGHTMNLGFDAAVGDYIGIVESDDFVSEDMFERLLTLSEENGLDVCKAGFYYYFSAPEKRAVPSLSPKRSLAGRVFCPTTHFNTLLAEVEFFTLKPTIWSAIYRREFIRDGGIRFNETPGASYQDASFNFKVWALAERVMLIPERFLYYRQDNEASSVNSRGKAYCVCDEYLEMERFITERNLGGRLNAVRCAMKYDTYLWNYERLSEELAREFLLFASEELGRDMATGNCPREAYSARKWNGLRFLISNPEEFHRMRLSERAGEKPLAEGEVGGSALKRGLLMLRRNGPFYTVKRLFLKMKRIFRKK